MRGIFLVEAVLQGDSTDAAVIGVDAEGRRVRIEVPTERASSIRPGSALVLQWWTADMPMMSAMITEAATSDIAATPEEDTTSDAVEAEDDERVERDFRALIGLL